MKTLTLIQDIEAYGEFWTPREIIRARMNPSTFGRGHRAANRAWARAQSMVVYGTPLTPQQGEQFKRLLQVAERATGGAK